MSTNTLLDVIAVVIVAAFVFAIAVLIFNDRDTRRILGVLTLLALTGFILVWALSRVMGLPFF